MHYDPRHYDALASDVGLVASTRRTQIELTGADRSTLLHNLCTSDIQKLQPGMGCETFLTSVQGRVLGHGYVFCGTDSLVLDTVAGQSQTLMRHIEKYIIREDVVLNDRSDEWQEAILAGPNAGRLLGAVIDEGLPGEPLAHVGTRIGGLPVNVRRTDLLWPGGFLVRSTTVDGVVISRRLEQAGAVVCGEAAFEALRIETGTPQYGVDISDANFPQEVGRDAQAINFHKGCYLGQETVARLDALGHVNRKLAGLRFQAAEVPPPGTRVFHDEDARKAVGEVTSSAWSTALDAPLALAYVRCPHDAPGTALCSERDAVQVVSMPVVTGQ